MPSNSLTNEELAKGYQLLANVIACDGGKRKYRAYFDFGDWCLDYVPTLIALSKRTIEAEAELARLRKGTDEAHTA